MDFSQLWASLSQVWAEISCFPIILSFFSIKIAAKQVLSCLWQENEGQKSVNIAKFLWLSNTTESFICVENYLLNSAHQHCSVLKITINVKNTLHVSSRQDFVDFRKFQDFSVYVSLTS